MDDQLRDELAKLAEEMSSLQGRLQALQRRLHLLELQSRTRASAATPPPPPLPHERAAAAAAAQPLVLKPVETPAQAPPPAEPPPEAAPTEGPRVESGVAAALAEPQADQAKPKPDMSLEQRVGASWLNKVGIVVFVLGVLFFCQLAVQRGWWQPRYRGLGVAVMGLVLLAIGERSLRKSMRLFAAGLTGGGIALLYLAVYLASPEVHKNLLTTEWAFGLMCVVTIIGIGLSLRSGMITTAILAQIGAYLTPIVLSTGKNEQVVLMTYLLCVAAGFLVVAVIRRWAALGPIALGSTVLVFVLWHVKYYDPPQWLSTDGFAWALLSMFFLYAAAATALKRVREELAFPLVLAASAAVWLLWATQADHLSGAALMTQLLLLAAAMAVVSGLRRWEHVALTALGGTAAVFALWYRVYGDPAQWAGTNAFAWAIFAVLAGHGLLMSAMRRMHEHVNIGIVAAAGALLALLWADMAQQGAPEAWTVGQLVVLDGLILAACLWRRWNWLRAGALAWTLGLLVLTIDGDRLGGGYSVLWSFRAWVFFGIFTADVLIRAWWRRRPTEERLDACLATIAMASMFGATYALLRDDYPRWMGLYTVALAASALVLAWALRRLANRRILAYASLGQGLVLLTLAAPIHFDKSSVAIAWGAQGVVSMFLARRLRSRLLIAKSTIVLMLAIVHFAVIDAATHKILLEVPFAVAGVDITYMLMLGVGMALAALAAAAILRAGPPIESDKEEKLVAGLLVGVGAILYASIACYQLPAVAATWWWLVLAAGVAAVAVRVRSDWLPAAAGAMLGAVTAKFLFYDTLIRRLEASAVPDPARLVALNWQFAAGLVVAAVALLFGRPLGKRLARWDPYGAVAIVAMLLAALLVVWAGTFEVDRYFTGAPAGQFKDVSEARQMGFSVWWAIYASALLVVGFVARRPPLRFMALGVFAVTLAKVLIVDLARIDLIYRVASFLALGGLLVAASFIYQRHFQRVVASWDKGRADE